MMAESNNNDEHTGEIKSDVGLITGAALVGGTKLVYEAGKDLYSWFKPEKKMFIQLLDSIYINKHHIIKARLASAHVHGVHIESILLKDRSSSDINVYQIHAGDAMGYGKPKIDSEDRILSYPYLLSPSGTLDVYIKLPEQTDPKIVKENGVNFVCTFSPLDKLGDVETVSSTVRLRWA